MYFFYDNIDNCEIYLTTTVLEYSGSEEKANSYVIFNFIMIIWGLSPD